MKISIFNVNMVRIISLTLHNLKDIITAISKLILLGNVRISLSVFETKTYVIDISVTVEDEKKIVAFKSEFDDYFAPNIDAVQNKLQNALFGECSEPEEFEIVHDEMCLMVPTGYDNEDLIERFSTYLRRSLITESFITEFNLTNKPVQKHIDEVYDKEMHLSSIYDYFLLNRTIYQENIKNSTLRYNKDGSPRFTLKFYEIFENTVCIKILLGSYCVGHFYMKSRRPQARLIILVKNAEIKEAYRNKNDGSLILIDSYEKVSKFILSL